MCFEKDEDSNDNDNVERERAVVFLNASQDRSGLKVKCVIWALLDAIMLDGNDTFFVIEVPLRCPGRSVEIEVIMLA